MLRPFSAKRAGLFLFAEDELSFFQSKVITALEAINLIDSHQTVVVSHVSAEPRNFYELIGSRGLSLTDTKILGANPTKNYPCLSDVKLDGRVSFDLMFLNPHVRQVLRRPHIHYAPNHMSRWASYMTRAARQRRGGADHSRPVDVFWGTCSLPNEAGVVSLGLNACYEAEMLRQAKCVILEMNARVPFTFGATNIPVDDVTHFVASDYGPPAHDSAEPGPEELKIGQFVAELVSDGSTIQLGIGGIPNAIGTSLLGRKNLGVHTEMINDAIMRLYEAGVIDGSRKTLWPGKIIGAFVYGSERLYKFAHLNSGLELHPASLVNDRATIAKNHKMTSINTAVEIDLTGQVCSESVGHGEITGVGGASDTHTGAQYASGGRGIIALRSTTKDGQRSKIVCALAQGAKVSISRNDIDTVITEYGVAELSGKNAGERARALIAIAHPKFRDELRHDAKREGYI